MKTNDQIFFSIGFATARVDALRAVKDRWTTSHQHPSDKAVHPSCAAKSNTERPARNCRSVLMNHGIISIT